MRFVSLVIPKTNTCMGPAEVARGIDTSYNVLLSARPAPPSSPLLNTEN